MQSYRHLFYHKSPQESLRMANTTRKDQTLDKQSIPRESTHTVFHVKHGNTEYSIESTDKEVPRRNANTKRLKEELPSN